MKFVQLLSILYTSLFIFNAHAMNHSLPEIDKISLKLTSEKLPPKWSEIIFPLHCACEKGNIKKTQELIKKKVAIEKRRPTDNLTPLFIAVMKEHEKIVLLLLKNYASPNSKGVYLTKEYYPLHVAILRKNINIMRFLCEFGALIDCPHPQKPLFLATEQNLVDIARILLKHRAPLSSGNKKENNNVLHIASLKGYNETIALIASHCLWRVKKSHESLSINFKENTLQEKCLLAVIKNLNAFSKESVLQTIFPFLEKLIPWATDYIVKFMPMFYQKHLIKNWPKEEKTRFIFEHLIQNLNFDYLKHILKHRTRDGKTAYELAVAFQKDPATHQMLDTLYQSQNFKELPNIVQLNLIDMIKTELNI